jgi:hypothetical protein
VRVGELLAERQAGRDGALQEIGSLQHEGRRCLASSSRHGPCAGPREERCKRALDVSGEIARVERLPRGRLGQGHEALEHRVARGHERLQNPGAFAGHRRDRLARRQAEPSLHRGLGEGPRHVPLVQLDDDRNRGRIEIVGAQVLAEVLPAGAIVVLACRIGVGDEHDAVGPGEHDAPRRVVAHLAGHGVQLDADLVPEHVAQLEGEQIEEQRPIVRRLDRHELLTPLGIGEVVQDLEVRRLAAERRPVVHEFRVERPLGAVPLRHVPSP